MIANIKIVFRVSPEVRSVGESNSTVLSISTAYKDYGSWIADARICFPVKAKKKGISIA